ncbi:MAG TPA: Asp-tRNA(Asn)/Glu-tRNA(Gln) amidotransferase GatCAB subunit B, partial [Candidatus Acetothermia bacterium]|nr:Asp-tRNA(Asn)/Glu-tRNA(Gln) amidotransferase GatCAB subunit B [Candidatus Acetothermia bacterium]
METVIGLEIHVQLATATKLFCSCSTDYFQAPPNTLTCPVCLGMPGALPVLNVRAVELALRVALALGAEVQEVSHFDRKNYFYPDLPKGYQITQREVPLAVGGKLAFEVEGDERVVRIRELHIEEDAGKLIHTEDGALVDMNRCGIPLVEIVTEPDIRSPEEAREFLRALRTLLRHLRVSNADMEKGEMRCDANISVSRNGSLGTKT